MNSNVGDLIARYRDRGLVVDTNLLLVLLVGNIDRRLIGTTARTEKYSSADYARILDILVLFNRLIILPQILTETGNLLKRNCSTASTQIDLHREFLRFVHRPKTCESRPSSRRITTHPAFPDPGYADAAILHAANGKYLVFTDDGPLQGKAWQLGVDVLPFKWLQPD